MHQTSAKIFCVGFLIIFLASPTVAFLDFLDPFGIFSDTEAEEKVDIEEKVKLEQKPVTENLKTIENLEKTEITIPTSGEFNSSFLIVGKNRPLKLQCYFNINVNWHFSRHSERCLKCCPLVSSLPCLRAFR